MNDVPHFDPSAGVPLAQRMKAYEHVTRRTLPARSYMMLRLDGRSFHTYAKGLEQPFDVQFAADMDAAAVALCSEIAGAKLAYVQSDEISVVLTDFDRVHTQQWMGGVEAKLTSLSASKVTAVFNRLRPGREALFDSRAWTIPNVAEVDNYFVWRQRDAIKNSVTMAASTVRSHEQLQGLHTDDRLRILASEGIDFDDYPEGFRRGRVVVPVTSLADASFVRSNGEVVEQSALRRVWVAKPAPVFECRAGLLAQTVTDRDIEARSTR